MPNGDPYSTVLANNVTSRPWDWPCDLWMTCKSASDNSPNTHVVNGALRAILPTEMHQRIVRLVDVHQTLSFVRMNHFPLHVHLSGPEFDQILVLLSRIWSATEQRTQRHFVSKYYSLQRVRFMSDVSESIFDQCVHAQYRSPMEAAPRFGDWRRFIDETLRSHGTSNDFNDIDTNESRIKFILDSDLLK